MDFNYNDNKYIRWSILLSFVLNLLLLWIVFSNKFIVIDGSASLILLAMIVTAICCYFLWHTTKELDPLVIAKEIFMKHKEFYQTGYIINRKDLQILDLTKSLGLPFYLYYTPYARQAGTGSIKAITFSYDINKGTIAGIEEKSLNQVFQEYKENYAIRGNQNQQQNNREVKNE